MAREKINLIFFLFIRRLCLSWLHHKMYWSRSRSSLPPCYRLRAPASRARKVRAKINNKLTFAFRSEICNEQFFDILVFMPAPRPFFPISTPLVHSSRPLAVADKLPGFELPFRLFMIFALCSRHHSLPLFPSFLCIPSLWHFLLYPILPQWLRREYGRFIC